MILIILIRKEECSENDHFMDTQIDFLENFATEPKN